MGKTGTKICKVSQKKLKVLYSKEEIICLINENQKKIENKVEPVKKMTPGSISFVPSVAGLIIAGEVIKDIIGKCEKQI